MQYVLALWRHRIALVVLTLACGLAAFLASWRTAPVYEASAQLVVSQSKVGELTNQPTVSVATYKAMLDNQSVAAEILAEFGLDKPPYALTVSAFLAGSVTSEIVRDTNVIDVKVRLTDRVLAAKVANRFVERAVELAQRLSQDETVTARDIIKVQVDQSRQRLDQVEARLQAFKREAQLDLTKKDVESLLGQRGRLVSLLVDIEGEKARLAKAEEEIARQQRVRTERSAVDVGDGLRQAIREQNQQRDPEAPLLPFRSESLNPFINPVYELLNEQIAMSRTRLASLEKQRAELMGALKLNAPQLAELTQMYAKEIEQSRLETEYDLAKKVYVDVATRYEQARLQVASRTAQLQVLDRALPPDRPIAPRPLRNTAIALVVGFMLSALGILIFDYIATSRSAPPVKSDRPSEPAQTGV